MKTNSKKYILGLRTSQLQIFHNRSRFRLLVAGRRFGKTELALMEMLFAAQKPNGKIWYVAPSYRQAKVIAWRRIKKLTRPYWSKTPSETELTIHLTFGSSISLRGADSPDSLRGSGLDFVVLDEFANMDPVAWPDVLRPALAERQGRALFIGTPKGHNHFYNLFKYAQSGADSEWAAFQFSTSQGGLVPPSEIASASRQLDKESFLQEFEGQFVDAGRSTVYYAFKRDIHVKPLTFEKLHPLIWTIDFNVNPMSMLLIQCVNGGKIVHVLDEISLKHSNTQQACDAFLHRLSPLHNLIPAYQRPLDIHIYGDASGNQHRTSGTDTDWAIVRNFFSQWKGQLNPSIHTNKVNPAVRDRVNCVNSRLLNIYDEAHLFIDPRCTELIHDLEQVVWQVEPNGQTGSLINKSDPKRTHMSDALGYYIAQAFPLRPLAGPNDSGRIYDFG